MLGKTTNPQNNRQLAQNRLWNSRFGIRLARLEAQLLHPLLRRLHGESVLWIGDQEELPLVLRQSMIRFPIQALSAVEKSRACPEALPLFQTRCDQLPLATSSMDGVVLHHALERCTDARACIREVERVLKPGGRLIICTFNPLSLTGLRKLCHRSAANPLFGQHIVNPFRLLDWLALLDFCSDEAPRFYSVSGPTVVAQMRPIRRRTKELLSFDPQSYVSRLLRLPRRALVQTWRLSGRLVKRLPLGGIFVVSAIKDRQSGTLVGRELPVRGRGRREFVFSPSARSKHNG